MIGEVRTGDFEQDFTRVQRQEAAANTLTGARMKINQAHQEMTDLFGEAAGGFRSSISENCRLQEQRRNQTEPKINMNMKSFQTKGVNAETKIQDLGVLPYLMKLQALLMQLSVPQVRGDFLYGRIVNYDEPEMILVALDGMRNIMIPTRIGNKMLGGLSTEKLMGIVMALYARKNEKFVIPAAILRLEVETYAIWAQHVDDLICSPYWNGFVHETNELVPKLSPVGDNFQHFESLQQRHGVDAWADGLLSHKNRVSSPHVVHDDVHKDHRVKNGKLPIEEICLDSSDESDFDDSMSLAGEPLKRGKTYKVVKPPHLRYNSAFVEISKIIEHSLLINRKCL